MDQILLVPRMVFIYKFHCICTLCMYQWSLRFETPVLKTSILRLARSGTTLYVVNINIPLHFKTNFNLRLYFIGLMGGLKMQGSLYMQSGALAEQEEN